MNDDSEPMTVNTKGLDQLLKALRKEPPMAKVGILGSKTIRKEQKGPTNAEVGALYEFNDGSRAGGSFLRVPISEHLEKAMENAGAFDEDTLRDVIKLGSVVPWVKKVAVLAEGVVSDAFDTGGDGKWKPSDMTHKKIQQTLVETKQLRESITSEVKDTA